MATDGPTPPLMNIEIFLNGEPVVLVGLVSSTAMEPWVQKVAKESGQLVDWHLVAGWANVKTLGDPKIVKQTARELAKELPDGIFLWQ